MPYCPARLKANFVISIQVCAQSTETAMALAEMHPSLCFIVQMAPENYGVGGMDRLSGSITVQERVPASVQVVKNAAVYVLRLTTSSTPLPAQMFAELSAHLGVLRASPSATLILVLPLLPEPGAVSPDKEAKARLRDLCLLQLTNQCEVELGELLEGVNGVGDSNGRLVIASRLRSPESALVALGVKYQAFADRNHTAEPAISTDLIGLDWT